MPFNIRLTDGLRPEPGVSRNYGPFRSVRLSGGVIAASSSDGGESIVLAKQDADGRWNDGADDMLFADVEVIDADVSLAPLPPPPPPDYPDPVPVGRLARRSATG